MKASASIVASTQQQARQRAEFAFRDFYGEGVKYEIVEESAESYMETMAESIVDWRCEFVAEAAAA